jgi:hypothetical protein
MKRSGQRLGWEVREVLSGKLLRFQELSP